MELFMDVLADSLKDTLQLVLFLFITYFVMETIEHSTEGKAEKLIRRAGTAGPAVGAALGALPQCGFSAMAGTLYAGRIITAGTLVAVILSTSDELIPVFLAHAAPVSQLAAILVTKVVIGLIVGFGVDVVLRALHRTGDGHPHIRELCERAHCHCGDIEDEDVPFRASTDAVVRDHDHACDCDHDHNHAHGHSHAHTGSRWGHILRSTLVHTVQVSVFIFVITLVFGLIIAGLGSDVIASFFGQNPVIASFLSALVGLIPNCGASVTIAELYLDGTLATGPMLAGLLVSGGMGLLVLFRTNADMRQNIIIAVFIYAVGVLAGLLATLVGVVF